MSGMEYSAEERAAMIKKMHAASNDFYLKACHTGVHAFIEFAGLMNEFIKLCEDADAAGDAEWPLHNTHTAAALPVAPHHLAYLAEKLDCIYGPGIEKVTSDLRKAIEPASFVKLGDNWP